MEMSKESRTAWDIIENTGANLFLTGKAGTGKTTFLKELRRLSPKRMVVLAPTGIAAINAGGVTIHSFFQLPLSPYVPGATFGGSDNRRFKVGKVKRNIIRTTDLIVIDEISMVRADLLDAVDSMMRRYRKHDKPFGGAQLLMIGDVQQLAPVVKDDEWAMLSQVYDTPYFFSSKALAMAGYLTVELKTVYRQQDDRFIALLNQIRENRATAETLTELNRRYIPNFRPAQDSDYIRLTTHNRPAQEINDQELDKLPSKLYTFNAEVGGNFPETSFPADFQLRLKAGAQIMFIKNDANHRYFNGMIGEVLEVEDDSITVCGKNGGSPFEIEKAEWTNSKYTLDETTKEIKESVEGVFRQYPVRLAWAITIHKSQGLTFEHAIIDASNSFAHGQTYVALSRCKSLDGLVLSQPLSPSAIISDSQLDAFNSHVADNAPTDGQVSSLARDFVVANMDDLFDMSGLKAATNMVIRTLSEHLSRRYADLLNAYRRTIAPMEQLMAVARKFRVQYTQLLADNGDAANPQIQERIHKGAEYFRESLKELGQLIKKTKVSTDNKTVSKQFDERFDVLKETFGMKIQLLDYESKPETEFSVADYLRAKACFLLGQQPPSPSKKQKRTAKSIVSQANGTIPSQTSSTTTSPANEPKQSKEPKPKKVPTGEISFEMFNGGMSIEQIAEERNLAVSTVFGHLVKFVAEGRLALSRLVSREHEIAISNYLISHPEATTMSEVRDALGDSISYNEIRAVIVSMEKEREQG